MVIYRTFNKKKAEEAAKEINKMWPCIVGITELKDGSYNLFYKNSLDLSVGQKRSIPHWISGVMYGRHGE